MIASGTIAVVVALIGILIYVWFRFEWQFAVAAIASLIHDVTGTIGLYSLFQLEFNVSSIAALVSSSVSSSGAAVLSLSTTPRTLSST